jgi:fructosamine-3-kinase
MSMFELEDYHDTGYKIADIFQLYNILVNSNQYGGERLTTAFKACSRKDSILNQYLSFIAT